MKKFIKITVTENSIDVENNGLSNHEIIGALELSKELVINGAIVKAKAIVKGKKNVQSKK